MKTARAEAVDAAGRTVAHQILSAQCRSMPRRFPRVEAPERGDLRLHLDLAAGADQVDVVDRLLGLGAQPLDIGQGEVSWVVLADPLGTPFCVLADKLRYRDAGPIAAISIDSPDPGRDAAFWSGLIDWPHAQDGPDTDLQHPSGRGPLLEFYPEPRRKAGKNRIHLDVRPGPQEDGDTALARALDLGATRLRHEWGELPWTVLADPGGNEFCLLGAPAANDFLG